MPYFLLELRIGALTVLKAEFDPTWWTKALIPLLMPWFIGKARRGTPPDYSPPS